MKKFFILFILLLFTSASHAQENNSFVDSILNLVVKNQISVFNESFIKIKNSEINTTIIDTAVNDIWTRPRFIDNIYHPSFDGVSDQYSIIYDTSTNKIRSNYLDFKISHHDNNGNFQFEKTVFSIDKKEKKKEVSFDSQQQFPALKNTIWQNEEIQYGKIKFQLDSCHVIFRLVFNDDFSFTQFYGKNKNHCHTKDMKPNIVIGIEGGNGKDFFNYADKVKGHFVENSNGFWQTENNVLHFLNKDKQKINSFQILSITEKELELKLLNSEYIVKMKRVN